MSRRRRADDFTDSLSSFHQTGEIQSTHETCSKDSLDADSKRNESSKHSSSKDSLDADSKRNESSKHSSSKDTKSFLDSVILAGHVAQYVPSSNLETICEKTKTLGISDATSYLSVKSDLNKCINLFHNKYLNKNYDNSEENIVSQSVSLETGSSQFTVSNNLKKHKSVEIQCNLSDRPCSTSSKNITLSNIQVRRSKSCITFNCDSKWDSKCDNKTDQFLLAEIEDKTSHKKMETVVSLDAPLLSKSLLKDRCSPKEEEKEKYESISSERSSTEGLNPSELIAFLRSLEDSRPLQETDMLRRLSVYFCQDSPEHFAKRLLTIVEESFVNVDPEADYLDGSLYKFNEELRKIREKDEKIEDETAPEWVQSPSILIACKRKGSQEFISDRSKKPVTIAISSKGSTASISSPNIKSPRKVYRCTPKNLKSPLLHDSTVTFESIEAFCKGLYPDEYKTCHVEKKSPSDSPFKTLNTILDTCDNQMASLENSPNIYEKLKEVATTSTSNAIRLHDKHETQHLQENVLLSHRGKTDLKDKDTPDKNTPKQRTKVNGSSERHEIIDMVDLKDTLMCEIAKKRQSYLNTAKVTEIDADLKATTTQKNCPKIIVSQDSNSTGYDPKFMEIVKAVKEYQDYLDQHKPLLSFLQRGSLCGSSCEKKDISSKKTSTGDFFIANAITSLSSNKENIKTLQVPKSSLTRRKSRSPSSAKRNKVVAKPKLFVTPTKPRPIKSCKTRSNRKYFPNLGATCDVKKKRDLSPQEKDVYRNMENYDHVISPVGTYIRGTNPYLVKNLHPKTDEMLLTPRKRQTIQQSPSLKPKLKFRLSPKQPKTEQAKTSGKVQLDLVSHPKVHYKLPSHVRTIKEADNRKIGNRVNELLRSAQDKVVIRHEGRTKLVQADSSEQPEIRYDSAEESVHIEQTARKTYFSRVQNT